MPAELIHARQQPGVDPDRPLLEAMGIEARTPAEVSTDGDMIVISPLRDSDRSEKLRAGMEEIHRHFGGLFCRLAE